MSRQAHQRFDAERYYKTHTPLHGRNKIYKQDLAAISESNSPVSKAHNLVRERRNEKVDAIIEVILKNLQGKRKRYTYNQHAVIAIANELNGVLDPQTQVPLWRAMLVKSRDQYLTKDEFYKGARAILSQHSLYDAKTMAP